MRFSRTRVVKVLLSYEDNAMQTVVQVAKPASGALEEAGETIRKYTPFCVCFVDRPSRGLTLYLHDVSARRTAQSGSNFPQYTVASNGIW
jgi:hypothetical protein